jgi:hypothetical protein
MLPLIPALILLPALLEAQGKPDFRRAWACGARSAERGVITDVVRELDARGKQLSVGVQWFVSGFDGNRLGVSAVLTRDGPGEPPLQRGSLVVTWNGFPQWDERRPWIAVLHRTSEAPNPSDGKLAFHYSGGQLGMSVPWRRVAALAAVAGTARLSLVDRTGRVIRSAEIELRQIEAAVARTRVGLAESRRKAAAFDERCETITEWLTF